MSIESTPPTARNEPEKARRERPTDADRERRNKMHLLVGEHVLQVLGAPGNLLDVQVRPLWSDRFRVNVVVGENLASCRVAKSYFLTTDGAGNILTSTPKITRTF